MSSRPSRQCMRGRKRSAPSATGRANKGTKRTQSNDEGATNAGPSRLVVESPITVSTPMTGEPMQLEDNNSTALHWQWSHSATSSSVGDSSNLTQGAEIAPGEIAMLKAKMGALGSQLSTLQQRYQRLQAMEPPSIETHSRSASMPQLSPHPQLVQSTDPNEGWAPSVVNIDTSGERVPKGIKCVPAFDNKTEDFQRWKLRLESVAEAYKWTDNQKRCAILSALQGEPARFAFKALGPEVWNDYNALIDELSA